MIINFTNEMNTIPFKEIKLGEVFSVSGLSSFYIKCRNPENNKICAVNLSSGIIFTDCSKWKCIIRSAVLNISEK